MEKVAIPPCSAEEIARLVSEGKVAQAYENLASTYRFFVAMEKEAPGEYKALHMTMLIGEMRSRVPRSKNAPG
jgi:hypothetical protein